MLIVDRPKWEFILEFPHLYSIDCGFQDDCFGNPVEATSIDLLLSGSEEEVSKCSHTLDYLISFVEENFH